VLAALSSIALLTSANIALADDQWMEIEMTLRNPSNWEDSFGDSIAVNSSRIVVGAPGDGELGHNDGSVHLFDLESGRHLATIYAQDAGPNHYFGDAVAAEEDIFMVGAVGGADVFDPGGAVYVFDFDTLEQLAKFFPEDTIQYQMFGAALASDASTVVIGAPGDSAPLPWSGSAYIYDLTDPSLPTQVAKVTRPNANNGEAFGESIAVHGEYLLVGASLAHTANGMTGDAVLFEVRTGAVHRSLMSRSVESSDEFGKAVALNSEIALVGATDGWNLSGGRVYAFDIATGAEIGRVLPAAPEMQSLFGSSVAIGSNTFAVGSMGHHSRGARAGAVYMFDLSTGEQVGQLLPHDATKEDRLGFSVAIADNQSVVSGARGSYPDNEAKRGKAYVFRPEVGLDLQAPTPGLPGAINTFVVSDVAPNGTVHLVYGLRHGDHTLDTCFGFYLDMQAPRRVGSAPADLQGRAEIEVVVSEQAAGVTTLLQVVEPERCRKSNVMSFDWPGI